jgi:energy-coupling factor transporter ATP-binding protein EcfA2
MWGPASYFGPVVDMISRVVIKNFKSIGEPGVDLALKPLTLLVGPNGGGKSSILEAIAVASQNHFSSELTRFPSWESLHKRDSPQGIVEVHFGPIDRQIGGARVTFEAKGSSFSFVGQLSRDPDTGNRLNSALRLNTFLLSAVRGDIPYAIGVDTAAQWVGTQGQRLLMLLAIIFGRRLHRDIADRIALWAGRFGIGELKAGLRSGGGAGADYLDSELKAVLDLALASTGARQILTVITQLFWSPEGSLLLIEEPEISLHPKAQIDVLEMFAEAIRERKHQIIATTHSVFILQALGYAVLKGWLKPEEMAVWHVEKGKEGTTATLLPLSEKGYLQEWVPSFNEVEKDLIREWSKSLPRE